MTDTFKSYTLRFSDPGFLELYDRWHKARRAWYDVWKTVPFDEGGPDMVYNPDHTLIKDPIKAASAKEFQDARRLYLDDIKSRSDD